MDNYISVPEMARVLGCSKSTLYKLVEQKKIKHYRVGNLIRFKLEDFVVEKENRNYEES